MGTLKETAYIVSFQSKYINIGRKIDIRFISQCDIYTVGFLVFFTLCIFSYIFQ